MSFELLYTSAPKGLKQGSRGFTTVLCTEGMPANLVSRLEALSGYRHVFTPQDARYNDNPVAFSHLRIITTGRARSILSRISVYGVDYSGRTNKLAHHIALDTNEQTAAGPAWLLLNGEILRTSWDGQLATPSFGPTIRPVDQAEAVCRNWQECTGDAGWGGVLAQHFVAPQARPRWILYSIDQQDALLALINESIALLPAKLRWQATFSTYTTNLPPEVECRLRCVLIDSPDALSVPSQSLLIDLTRPPVLDAGNAWIDLARTGKSAAVQESTATPINVPPMPSASLSPAPILDDDAPYRLQPPAVLPGNKVASRHGKATTSRPPAMGPPPTPKTKSYQYVLLATSAAVALLTLGLGIYSLARPNRANPIAGEAFAPKSEPPQTSSLQHNSTSDSHGAENGGAHETKQQPTPPGTGDTSGPTSRNGSPNANAPGSGGSSGQSGGAAGGGNPPDAGTRE
jgi:hypothetical protein